ncbi:translation elongation factor Ts [Buchnera aphidicola]|uniref:translation elongation factor Ts n=1 Tax=Buchnera aphidicola TaxID=9 RepID=UPI00094C9A6F|nr:translation elongation factor Ts [Buchnera aphidicola]
MDNLLILIKELRKKTGSGLMDCKKALIQSHGDLKKAIDYLRTSGICLALNKSSNKTKEGCVFSFINNSIGFLLELNAETDFVTNTMEFKNFGQDLVNYAGQKNIDDISSLQKIFKKKLLELINKVSENIIIHRIKKISGNHIVSYIHMNKIGVLVTSPLVKLSSEQKECMKNIAMHIVASNPLCLKKEDMPKRIIDHEFLIQTEVAKKIGKPPLLLDRIIAGRMKKFINNNTLLDQNFAMDNKKSVQEYLKEHNVVLSNFIRLQIGVK